MKNLISGITFICLILAGSIQAQNSLKSPDGNLAFTLETNPQNRQLEYTISYKNRPVILKSIIGISGFEDKLTLTPRQPKEINTQWSTVYGEYATIKDHYIQNTYLVDRDGQTVRLEVRAYNEGIAFRFNFDGDNSKRLTIKEETTDFAVPANSHCWFAPFAQADYSYLPVQNWPGQAERPLTLELGNHLYVCLAEAQMVDYSRTKFYVQKGEKDLIRCKMYDPVEILTPYQTPWRVVMVGEKPTDLLQHNSLILNLNKPCAISNTDWIRPGRFFRCVTLTEQGAKQAIDFAAKHHIQYVHFDAGWYGPENLDSSNPTQPIQAMPIPRIVHYAHNKKVGIWLYVNQLGLYKHLDEILPLYQSWGISGIKFGFVEVGSYYWTNWLHQAVKKCAKYHLMVDIHDEYRPTGFSRTYPNLLTQEGIRGNEEFPNGNTNTVLPFTRYIAGAADYTICYFQRKAFKTGLPDYKYLKNTPCHQMALSVINYSPAQFLYWYDKPQDVREVPELSFFDHLPVVWDDTKILDGQIGKYIALARRSGNQWYVAAITNTEQRKVNIDLSFLDPNQKYRITRFSDGGNEVKTPTHVNVLRQTLKGKREIEQVLQPNGGVVYLIQKEN